MMGRHAQTVNGETGMIGSYSLTHGSCVHAERAMFGAGTFPAVWYLAPPTVRKDLMRSFLPLMDPYLSSTKGFSPSWSWNHEWKKFRDVLKLWNQSVNPDSAWCDTTSTASAAATIKLFLSAPPRSRWSPEHRAPHPSWPHDKKWSKRQAPAGQIDVL